MNNETLLFSFLSSATSGAKVRISQALNTTPSPRSGHH